MRKFAEHLRRDVKALRKAHELADEPEAAVFLANCPEARPGQVGEGGVA